MADIAAPPPPPPPPAVAGGRRVAGWLVQRPALLFLQTVCVSAGALLFVVGGTDAAMGLTFPAKVFGAGLAVVGIALLATAAGIHSDRSWPGTVGSASLGAAAALSAFFAVRGWDEESEWALLFAVVAVAAVAALALLVRERRPVFGVKSASVLSVAGFAFTFFQFTYAQSAVTRVGSTVVLTPEIALIGDGPTTETLGIAINAANKTGAKVQLLGDLYVVEAIDLCKRSRSVSDQTLFGEALSTGDPDDAYTAQVAPKKVEVVQAGRVFEAGTYFEPGEEIVRRFTVPVSVFGYDVFRLRVRLAVANGDRLHLGDIAEGPAPIAEDSGPIRGASMTWQVTEASLADRLAHADREVVVRWESGTGEDVRPRLEAAVRLSAEPGISSMELSNVYGVAYVSSSVDIPTEGGDTAVPPGANRDPGPDGGRKVECRDDW